ncbi:hypothetical protein PBI_ASERPROCKY_94 [Gordonia phage ASerpRocky]|uniref:Uncharacterized protein n=1 Tax=Gordonia phage ASerpRocky TaxID=2599841 RepID=A0A5J6TCQ4_9CAUD|nr:hypothetical protein PBI_ASERPROCKY_94 [Gordonia phage ASerpRocky]
MSFHSTTRPQWLDEALEYMTAEIGTLDQNHPDPLVGDYRLHATPFETEPDKGFYVRVQKLDIYGEWRDISRFLETVVKHDSTSVLSDTTAALYDNALESR